MSGKHVLLWIAALLALAVLIALGALILRGLVRDEPMGLAHLAETRRVPRDVRHPLQGDNVSEPTSSAIS